MRRRRAAACCPHGPASGLSPPRKRCNLRGHFPNCLTPLGPFYWGTTAHRSLRAIAPQGDQSIPCCAVLCVSWAQWTGSLEPYLPATMDCIRVWRTTAMAPLGISSNWPVGAKDSRGYTAFASFRSACSLEAEALQFFLCFPQKSGLIQYRCWRNASVLPAPKDSAMERPAENASATAGLPFCLAAQMAQKFPLRWELGARATPLQFKELTSSSCF